MKSSTLRKALKSLSLAAIITAAPECIAAEITINTTETTTQTLNANESLTVTSTGSISVTGANTKAVNAPNGGNTITNNGRISTTGAIGSDAIRTQGNNTTVVNNGTISTVGQTSRGVYSSGSSNTIINNGAINSVDASAIVVDGGSSNQVINAGTLLVTGDGSRGIRVNGGSNTVVNSGSITVTGKNVDGTSPDGIYAQSNNNTVTNSGSIISYYGNAIAFTGSGNTLNLGNNSFLGGGIALGSGTQLNVTTGANYSKLINYTGTLNGLSTSGPIPVFTNTSTKQLATYDPTFFAASSDALADMTSTISSLTPGRFNGTEKEHPLWARGFGMTSSYSDSTATLARNYIYSGVSMGYDFTRTKRLMVGALGGYGQTSLGTQGTSMQSYNTSSDDGFIGLYGQRRWKNVWLDFGLYGGVQSFKQQRYVNDNLAYLGNSSSQASFSGWWLAPEAGVTYKAAEVNGWSLLPTARLRYAQQWMGGYSETGGGSANATVNGRNVTIGQSFVGVGTRKSIKTKLGSNTRMVLEGQVGYLYRGAVGDYTVEATMIGQSLSLPTEVTSRNAVAATAGVTIDLSSAVALKIRGDAAAGGGMKYVGGGWAGLSVSF